MRTVAASEDDDPDRECQEARLPGAEWFPGIKEGVVESPRDATASTRSSGIEGRWGGVAWLGPGTHHGSR